MKSLPRFAALVIALCAVTAMLFAACGDDNKDTSSSGTAAATSTVAVATFPADSTMAAIQKKGKVTIGVKYDLPLMGLLDPVSKKVDGFDVAIGKEIAKAMGLR